MCHAWDLQREQFMNGLDLPAHPPVIPALAANRR
jgi:hypothetical protein